MKTRFPFQIALVLLWTLGSIPILCALETRKSIPEHHRQPLNVILTGAKTFSSQKLRSEISRNLDEIKENGLNGASADDAAFFLTLFYKKNGFADAQVTPVIQSGSHLELRIEEGPLSLLDQVHFSGVSAFSEESLEALLIQKARRKDSLRIFKDRTPVVEATLDEGIDRITGYYRNHGYLDVKVSAPDLAVSPGKNGQGKTVSVAVKIEEGPQYRFGSLTFDGDLALHTPEELQKALATFSSQPFTEMDVANMKRALVYFFQKRGYYKASVETDFKIPESGDRLVPVHFHIVPGQIYRFGQASEKGLERLHPGFLKRRLSVLNGKPYNPQNLEDVYASLMRSGLFNSLKIDTDPQPDGMLQLNSTAEEAKSKELGIALGYGTIEGAILEVDAAERNLMGTGRPVSGSFEFAQKVLKGTAEYRDPWFLDSTFTLKLRGGVLNQIFDGYTKLESGGVIEISHAFGKPVLATLFMAPRHVDITTLDIHPPSLAGPTSYNMNSIGTSLNIDLRDSVGNPSRGVLLTAAADYASHALGSDFNFLRTTARATWYLPVRPVLFAFGARGGILIPFHGQQSVPIDERFFNGGSRSVRSFVERTLGPLDPNGHPTGGDTFVTLNAEMEFPIYGNLAGTTFIDAGSVGNGQGTGGGLLRYGVGGGLRYKLPVGPVRVDYGVNPAPRPGEKNGALQISFGVAF